MASLFSPTLGFTTNPGGAMERGLIVNDSTLQNMDTISKITLRQLHNQINLSVTFSVDYRNPQLRYDEHAFMYIVNIAKDI